MVFSTGHNTTIAWTLRIVSGGSGSKSYTSDSPGQYSVRFTGLTNGRQACVRVSGGGHSDADCAIPSEPPPPVKALTATFGATAYTATEGGRAAQVSIALDQPSDRNLVIPLSTDPPSGNFVAPASIDFAAGDQTATAMITAAADDNFDNETVEISFGTLPNRVSAGTQATTTVILADAGLSISFAAATYVATEGGPAVPVGITLAEPIDRDLTIPLNTSPASGNFTATTSVSIASGAQTATAAVTATADDNFDNETVEISFGTLPTPVTAGSRTSTTVHLLDANRADLTVSFAAASYTATEGGAAAAVTVRLNKAADRPLVVPLRTHPTSGNFTVPAYVSFTSGARAADATVTAADDANFDNETVEISFGTLPDGVSPGTLSTTTVTLADAGYTPLTVSFGADAYTATERGDDARVPITLDQPSDRDLVIPLNTIPPTGNFTLPATVTIASGAQTATAAVTATVDDNLDAEHVEISFGTLPDGVSAGALSATTVTLDDAGKTDLTLDASATTVTEGATATLTVSLSRPFPETVTFQWSTAPGSATGGDDYTAQPPTAVSLAPGDTSTTLSVATRADFIPEPDETFIVTLAADTLPAGVLLGIAVAAVTIEDGDAAIGAPRTLRILDDALTAVEGGPPIDIQFQLDPPPDHAVSIPLLTSPLRGLTPIDHSPLPDALSFPPAAGRATATITATVDSHDDPDEALLVTFGELPAGISVIGPDAVLITFQQPSPRETLASSLPVLLAAAARSISATGQAAVETRLSRKRQQHANHVRPRRYDATGPPSLFSPPPDPTAPSRTPAATAALQQPFFLEDPGGLALWGDATLTQFSGHPAASDVDYQGRLWSALLGVDLLSGPAGLVGLAVSRDAARVASSAAHYAGGALTARVYNVRPYAYWQPGSRVALWTTVAVGTGHVSATLDDAAIHNAKLGGGTFSAGSDTLLYARNGTQLRIRADAFATQLTATGSGLSSQVRGSATQARLLLDWARDTALSRGRDLRLHFQGGARYDRGDADRGLGAESTARVAYLDPGAGFDISLFARSLLAHRDGHRDSAFGLQASWDPGSVGLGWQVAVTAARGDDAIGRNVAWDDPTSLATGTPAGAHLDGQLAYAVPLSRANARLTWHTNITTLPPRRAFRTGATVHILPRAPGARPIRCDLRAARILDTHGTPDYALSLQISVPF